MFFSYRRNDRHLTTVIYQSSKRGFQYHLNRRQVFLLSETQRRGQDLSLVFEARRAEASMRPMNAVHGCSSSYLILAGNQRLVGRDSFTLRLDDARLAFKSVSIR